MARRAFSLLELTIVVVILAAAAVIAAPRVFGTTSRARLQAAAQRLAQDIEATRERARTLGIYQTMCFSTEGYTVIERTPSTEEKVSTLLNEDPYNATIGWVVLKSGSELSFDGFGVPSTAAMVKVTNGRDAYIVSVNAGAGSVAVSSRASDAQADTAKASETPVAIADDVADIIPTPRVNVKVRFGVINVELDTTVTSVIEAVEPN
jgi:prepilin-type N-terminal cleavage/methylation domain-containing protein